MRRKQPKRKAKLDLRTKTVKTHVIMRIDGKDRAGEILRQHTMAIAMMAAEYGYKYCENGFNLQHTLEAIRQCINNPIPKK